MRKWIAGVIRFRVLTLVLTLVVTLAAIYSLRSLKVIIDPDEALPQTHPYVIANNEVERLFGNKLTMVIGIHAESESMLTRQNLDRIERLSARLEKVPGLVKGSLVSLTSESVRFALPGPAGIAVVSLKEAMAQMGEENITKLFDGDSAYTGLLLSKDQRTAQIIAEFQKIPEGFGQIDHHTREAVSAEQAPGVEFWVGGVPAFLTLLEKYSARMAVLFPFALLMIGLIHYEAFRTLQALFLPLVTALLAVVWALGILGFFGQPIDVFNASTPILILAVAAGHAVQILKRYYEEFALVLAEGSTDSAENNRQAVLRSLAKVGPVMAAACIVAALGFFSLVIFEIKSIQVFGLFTGAGILSALVLELSFIPALRACLPAPGQKEYVNERKASFWDRVVAAYLNLVITKRKQIFAAAGLFAITLAIFAAKVEMENSQKSYFWGKIAERQQDDRLNEEMSGTNSLYVVVEREEENGIWQANVLKGLERTQEFLAQHSIVGKSIGITDIIKGFHRAAMGGDKKFQSLPEDMPRFLGALRAQGAAIPGADSFTANNGRATKLQIFLRTDRTSQVEAVVKDLQRFTATAFPAGTKVLVGGGVAGGVALNEVMIREKILNILQIMGAVFLVSAILFRSLLAGLLILVPLVAAVLANFGIMGAFGIPLQIATALVSAMAVGIGADYGIYLSYRLREELAVPGRDEAEAIRRAFLSAGKATLFVSSAVAGGFGVLMLSIGFNVHFWMGLLIGVSMLVSSVAALTIFPALVFALRANFVFGRNSK